MNGSTKIKVQRRSIPEMVRNYIFKRDGYECIGCGSSENLVIDHIRPFSKNGETEIDNLQTLCHQCNMKKGNGEDGYELPFSVAKMRKRIINGDFLLKVETQKAGNKVEKMCIHIALNELNWNRRKSAKLLGISYRSLLYKIKDYGLR